MNPLLGATAAWGWAEAPQSPDRTRVRFKGMDTAAPLSPDRVRIASDIFRPHKSLSPVKPTPSGTPGPAQHAAASS